MRCRQEYAFTSRRNGGDPAGIEKDSAPLLRLPRDAQGEGPRHLPRRHARPLACPGHDRRRAVRRRRVGAEAHLGRRGGRPEHGGRCPQTWTRRAGRHAAAQHAAPDRSPRPDCPRGQTGQGRIGGDLLLQRWRRRAGPARDGTARQPGLRNVDRPRAHAAFHSRQASARLAPVHGIRQRHARRHGHPHVRHGPLVHGPGLAQTHLFNRRHHGEDRTQGEYCRHPDGDVRLRQSRNRLAAPLLGRRRARPQVSLGRHLVWR